MKIKAKTNASKRTKDRIREHGASLTVVKSTPNQILFTGKNDWLGWLPKNELEGM